VQTGDVSGNIKHMKTKSIFSIRDACQSFGVMCVVALVLQFGVLAGSAQTNKNLLTGDAGLSANWHHGPPSTVNYLFTGSETTVTLKPGTYDITAYGAQGGGFYYGNSGVGGQGAKVEAQFYFSNTVTLTILVGGAGDSGVVAEINGGGGGGGGGSFVVNVSTPLLIAGGGGGGGFGRGGGAGMNTTSGGDGGLLGLFGSGLGGSDGSGGGGGNNYGGGGGGGFYSGANGGDGYYGFGGENNGAGGGYSFINNGDGGYGIYSGGSGGFGGGGGGSFLFGGGGGGYSGGGGGDYGSGGGGGSFIDSSAIVEHHEISGISSPDDAPNGEIIIRAMPTRPNFLPPAPYNPVHP
jgi:hypothetical protein